MGHIVYRYYSLFILVWVVVLIGIIGVLYWYCNHAKNLCDPANLVKKQWQLCILLMSTVCCFVTLWFRIVVVASVLSHLQDKHKHIDVMPLIASMITLTEGQHTYLFWISYSARVSLAAGLAVPLIAFSMLLFFCNNSNNTRTTSNNSNARNQIAVNRKKFKMNFMQNEVSTSDISDTRYLAKENRTEPLNTMLDIIVERNKDGETKSKEADVKDNQSETNAELSAVIIVQPNDTGRRTSNEDVVSDDDDDDDCYKLSSSFSQGLMEGRSRKTMMQLVKHSNANNSF
ncbi:hypothetical protein BDF19DRAFT_435431 [Syncephalis fuscata]|nr:hypothetical protein BDF19DRAFT_435431 [Syncephalis fuscata]